MQRFVAAFAFLALAACTPPEDGPVDAVKGIYAAAQENIGHAVTPMASIPLTDDLKGLLDSAEAAAAARNEPFIEGDLALNCQDCQSVSDLVVGPQTGVQQEPPIDGHTWVQAKFKLNGDEERTVLWDMVKTPLGWRADNILSDGFNLRTEAQLYLAEPTQPQRAPEPPGVSAP